MERTDQDDAVVNDLRQAWHDLVKAASTESREGRALPPIALPYYPGTGSASEALYVDVTERRSIAFTGATVASMTEAVRRWVHDSNPNGRVHDHDALNMFVQAAATAVAESADSNAAFDEVVARRWAAVVAVPLGGAFLLDGPVEIGSRVVLGHLDRATEIAIADLALRWHRPLGGFHFNDEVAWTEDFLAAEEDGVFAEELENQLEDDNGWMPLVIALSLEAVGSIADFEAISVAQVLVAALHLLARNEASNPDTVLVPWVLDLDAPGVAYIAMDGERPAPTPLRIDTMTSSPGHPDAATTMGRHIPVEVRALLDAGFAPVLAAVLGGALEPDASTEASRVARACELIGPALRDPFTPQGAVTAWCAALVAEPTRQDMGIGMLLGKDPAERFALTEEAIAVVTSALLRLGRARP